MADKPFVSYFDIFSDVMGDLVSAHRQTPVRPLGTAITLDTDSFSNKLLSLFNPHSLVTSDGLATLSKVMRNDVGFKKGALALCATMMAVLPAVEDRQQFATSMASLRLVNYCSDAVQKEKAGTRRDLLVRTARKADALDIFTESENDTYASDEFIQDAINRYPFIPCLILYRLYLYRAAGK